MGSFFASMASGAVIVFAVAAPRAEAECPAVEFVISEVHTPQPTVVVVRPPEPPRVTVEKSVVRQTECANGVCRVVVRERDGERQPVRNAVQAAATVAASVVAHDGERRQPVRRVARGLFGRRGCR